jgi:hypothetical protein
LADPDVLDRLYSLAPEEFTAARNALVKELTKAGDRLAASELKALRKPTVIAWSLNQVARTHGREVEELLAAAGRVRQAQEAGEPRALREASGEEQEVLVRLSGLALKEMSSAGHPPNETARTRLLSTLRAAARDEGVAEQLRRGRLSAEARFVGFPTDLDVPAGGIRDREAPAQPQARRAGSARAVQAARKELDRLEAEVKRAARRARDRSESAARARAAADEADGAAREAEEQLAALRIDADEAARRLKELEEASG